jgi:hypothetical protein
MWFHNFFFAFTPKLVFDIFIIIHGSIGFILTLFLVLWHLYLVHLRPERFPVDMSFWDGKISEERLKEEHPLEYEQGK